MDVINDNNRQEQENQFWRENEKTQNRGRLFGGLFVIAAGTLFLLRELGVMIPEWVFTWQMLLITIGVFIGLKHAFKSFGWIILVLIGSAFMIKEFVPWFEAGKLFWPIAIILVGIFLIFKPRRESCENRMEWKRYRKQRSYTDTTSGNDDFIDFNAVFGSINKKIISKTFRGGEVNTVFGGAEINLMQADFTGKIELEVNSVFGGTRLIIPSNWNVKSEIAAVMGSVEDKRPVHTDLASDPEKILILRGNAVFGGIEIQSFS